MIMVNCIPQVLLAALWVVIFSLKAARASGSRVLRGPGFVLSLAAVVATILTIIVQWLPHIRHGRLNVIAKFGFLIANEIMPRVGFMVLGSWMTLALVGRGRPEPSVLDRVGYGLGMSLIVVLGLESVRFLLEYAPVMQGSRPVMIFSPF